MWPGCKISHPASLCDHKKNLPPLSPGPVPSRCMPHPRRPLPRARPSCTAADPGPSQTCLVCLAEEPSVRAIELRHRGRRGPRAWAVARGEGPARAPAAGPLRWQQRPPEAQAGQARDPSPPPAASHSQQWGRDSRSAPRAVCRLHARSLTRSGSLIGELPATLAQYAMPIGRSGGVSTQVFCAGSVWPTLFYS